MDDPRLVIVTGMSGAGRSETANVLEDNDFFVVDNLPLRLIPNVVDEVGLPLDLQGDDSFVEASLTHLGCIDRGFEPLPPAE